MRWPRGFTGAGVACGIKEHLEKDLGILVAARPALWAGTFTRNGAAAAPVLWSRSLRGRSLRAVVVNSGNANACTGTVGERAVEETARAAAISLGCLSEEVAVASTGPIGVPLPVERVVAAFPGALSELDVSTAPFASSILTTDTRPKIASARAADAMIVGVAKGAAMLAPNMATMLAFITTDASIGEDALQETLDEAVARTFDRVSVDGCESTNDSVYLLSSDHVDVEVGDFGRRLEEVCSSLAHQMVSDAEGATKVIRIQVTGAADEDDAAFLARAVASSALWRAAAAGGDPNWGRIVAALGSADRDLDLAALEVALGPEIVFSGGLPTGSIDAAAKAMRADELVVSCRVGTGPGEAEILTTDLTADYVRLNAGGMS